jgi:hypothetical protein
MNKNLHYYNSRFAGCKYTKSTLDKSMFFYAMKVEIISDARGV